MTIKHPTSLPDDIARKLADLARAHGYGIEHLTLVWQTRDLGQPLTARATYAPEVIESRMANGDIEYAAL